ncbi:MAG: TlyA family RNA methyltransferase [Syntrophaceae bacterium]|nr:TlyA family RNA methyltransferase [Syntrophaceae bacterium]
MSRSAPKIRLDDLLVERGLAQDRSQAQALILTGSVLVAGRPATHAGGTVPAAAEVRLRGETCPYVSRGGIKLQRALEAFGIEVTGLIALDVGASTGGFTDCLLQAGAAKVYAIDVGYGQLAWKLRTDPRVVTLERTNIRFYDGVGIADPIDLAVIDASFISLTAVLPPVLGLIGVGALVVALVKPQFEVAKGEVGLGGVVRDPERHRQILTTLEGFCRELGLVVLTRCESPLLGPAGNREFFLCLRKSTV